jgi:hypothetical protein
MGLSDRFVRLTYARYDHETGDPGLLGQSAILEQVAERYARECELRRKEDLEAVEVFLGAGGYPVDRIEKRVGVTVSFVEEVQTIRALINSRHGRAMQPAE